jgi:hypothetical protein
LYFSYLGFGLEAFMLAEITALRAWLGPHQEVRDEHATLFGTLLFLREPPPMTAAAMVGFTMDDASSPDPGMRASCGAPTGPVEEFDSPLSGEIRHRPARQDLLYDWRDCDEVEPREKTSIGVLARVTHEGPTNRISWFFPSRLQLDTAAVAALTLDEDSWQWRHGLRATRTSEVDLPVLVVTAGKGLVAVPSSFDSYRERIASVVGEPRPRAGAGRESDDLATSGFAVLALDDYAHDDIVHASCAGADEEIYRPLLEWILGNTEGSIEVPVVGQLQMFDGTKPK